MLVSLSDTLEEFKRNWTKAVSEEEIGKVCMELGCGARQRILGPVTTVQLMFLQVLHGNTAILHLPRLSKLKFSASAYCQARCRIPLELLQRILAGMNKGLEKEDVDDGRWYGHRTFVVDGSNFSMPDTAELQEYFGQPTGQTKGCGFPVANFLAVFHVTSGFLTEVLSAPLRWNALSHVAEIAPELKANDLLLGDRGFCSFVHLALLSKRKVHAVFRVHQCKKISFTPGNSQSVQKKRPTTRWLRAFGIQDQLVQWRKPVRRPKWMTAEQYDKLPHFIEVREVRYKVDTPGFRSEEITLVTTLTDAQRYPLKALAELYLKRWLVETNFSHLKTTMGMDILRCKTVDGVLKELYSFCVVYNLVRLVMLEAGIRQQVETERISFVDALRWLATAQPGELLPTLVINPSRPNRVEPRVKKRRPKEYPLMRMPRSVLQNKLLNQKLAA